MNYSDILFNLEQLLKVTITSVNDDLDCAQLDGLLPILEKYTVEKNILLLFGNFKFKNKIIQRVQELENFGITNFVVISLCKSLHDYLIETNKPTFLFELNLDNHNTRFIELQKRFYIYYYVLNNGYNVMGLDADTIIIKNPFDMINNQVGDVFLFRDICSYPQIVFDSWNYTVRTGFIYARCNQKASQFIYSIYKFSKYFGTCQCSCNHILYFKNYFIKSKQLIEIGLKSKRGQLNINNHKLNLNYESCEIDGLKIVELPHIYSTRFILEKYKEDLVLFDQSDYCHKVPCQEVGPNSFIAFHNSYPLPLETKLNDFYKYSEPTGNGVFYTIIINLSEFYNHMFNTFDINTIDTYKIKNKNYQIVFLDWVSLCDQDFTSFETIFKGKVMCLVLRSHIYNEVDIVKIQSFVKKIGVEFVLSTFLLNFSDRIKHLVKKIYVIELAIAAAELHEWAKNFNSVQKDIRNKLFNIELKFLDVAYSIQHSTKS